MELLQSMNARSVRVQLLRIMPALSIAVLLLAGCALVSIAGPPPLRDQISLNGTWDFTPQDEEKASILVPEFWDAAPGFECDQARYERTVAVPSDWKGQRVKVEFESVFFFAKVFVNGQCVGEHTGAWVPFSFDITESVTPGRSFRLRVEVKGGSQHPIRDSEGRIVWPVGWYGHQQHWGIAGDVWLRKYGQVHIEDAFIKTSFANKEIEVEYTIRNSDSTTHVVIPKFDAVRNSKAECSASGPSITLAPGEVQQVRVTKAWTDPALWTPRNPCLYHLESRLMEDPEVLDAETRRFGFREVTVRGNQFYLNGSRINLYGSSINWHGQSFKDTRYQFCDKDTWRATLKTYKSINIHMMRMHQEPGGRYIHDIADEEGFLIIAESAVYARSYLTSKYEPYVQNSEKWTAEWIRAYRNHPSIIMWSAFNEMVYIFGRLSEDQAMRLIDVVHQHDSTRPVSASGDDDLGGSLETCNLHYPEGYGRSYDEASIYAWKDRLKLDKPTGIGEFLTSYNTDEHSCAEENRWWHGTSIRGLRYLNFTDVRPYQLQYVLEDYRDHLDDKMIQNLKTSYAPIALFDRDYDDLGLDPVRRGKYPAVAAGEVITRPLVLYNDDFDATTIRVEVLIEVDGEVVAKGEEPFEVALGEHVDLACQFAVPKRGGQTMSMMLRTYKNEELMFQEPRYFVITGATDGETSNKVQITAASQ